MKTLASQIDPPDVADRICRDMTGRSVAEWEAEWRRRRVRHLHSGRLNGHSVHATGEREDVIRYYDLAEHDFEPVIAKMGTILALIPDDAKTWPVVTLPPHDAARHIQGHATRAAKSGQRVEPLAAMTMWRLRQDALRRIAAEAREMHVRAGEADLF
jgi:hypothetical protein